MTLVLPIIGVAGPRSLTGPERDQARRELYKLLNSGPRSRLHVGCARGLDAIATGLIYKCASAQSYVSEGPEPWQLQRRTKRLIAALAAERGTLHAWPNRPCPAALTRQSWKGSGTWGAMREAVALGVPVVFHPLGYLAVLPDWLPSIDFIDSTDWLTGYSWPEP